MEKEYFSKDKELLQTTKQLETLRCLTIKDTSEKHKQEYLKAKVRYADTIREVVECCNQTVLTRSMQNVTWILVCYQND